MGGTPMGDLVGLAVPGGQGLAFLITEDHQGLTPGGAVDPLSGDITTPACRFFPEVGQVPELPAHDEALPHGLDAPLPVGLVLGLSHPGGVGYEAPVDATACAGRPFEPWRSTATTMWHLSPNPPKR